MAVFEHNEGTIKLAANKDASRRTKNIDVKRHLVKKMCDAGKVRLVYVRTEDQHADVFIKSLDVQKFYKNTKTVLHVVRCGPNVGEYCEHSVCFSWE